MSRPNKAKTDAADGAATPTVKKVAKTPTGTVRRIKSANVAPAPMHQVVIRLMYESVAARIRHRALLHVFETYGKYDHQNYLDSYKLIYDRDHDALVARLMLPTADFTKEFGQWHEDDYAKYGIPDRVKTIAERAKTRAAQPRRKNKTE